ASPQFVTRLAMLVAAHGQDADLDHVLALFDKSAGAAPWQVAILEGLSQGLQTRGQSLDQFLEQPARAKTAETVRAFFTGSAAALKNGTSTLAERLSAARLLGFGPFNTAKAQLPDLLSPTQPRELQIAAVRGLAMHNEPSVGLMLLKPWSGYSPEVRRAAL